MHGWENYFNGLLILERWIFNGEWWHQEIYNQHIKIYILKSKEKRYRRCFLKKCYEHYFNISKQFFMNILKNN